MKKIFTLITLGSISLLSANTNTSSWYAQPSPDNNSAQVSYENGAPANYPSYYDNRLQGNLANNQNRPVSNQTEVVDDQEIAKHIQNALGGGWFSSGYPNVTFEVNNGYVILRGSVAQQADKDKLDSEIKKIAGVRQVSNQLMIGAGKPALNSRYSSVDESKFKKYQEKFPQDYAETNSDRQLNLKIRDKLNGGWFTKGYETIVIRSNKGAVTIIGTVEKFDDIQKIHDQLKDMDGIRALNIQVIPNTVK